MKLLIALLTAATGIMHLLIGFNIVAGFGAINWMLVLNGAGYLVLLFLFWTAEGSRRGTIRWVLLAYTLITLIGYFVLNAADNYGLNNTVALIVKAIELLLVILLFLYRPSERTVTTAPVAATATTRTVTAPAAPLATSSMTAATGAAVAGTAAMVDRSLDTTVDLTDETVAETDDFIEEVDDRAGDAVDYVGDKTEDAYDAVAGAAGAAVDEVQDLTTPDAAELDAAQLQAEPTAADLRTELEEYLRSFGPSSEFRKEIEYIEGIGPVYGQKLRGAGIATVLDLLVNGATRRGRKHIADQTGLQQSQILTWVNHVDLFRIKGVAQEYADLLEQSGVDTVVELAQRNPANLHKRMLDINEQRALVRRAPHASEVQSWVEQAKSLRRLIYY